MNGQVILVGAGPGDGGLLTLRGAQALRDAQVVVYDRLVGEDVLAMIPQIAERINVGKQNSQHLVPQDEINQILLRKAREGKRVVRLKGGDCYLFGRGGEEAETLADAGVYFEVVPGVTAALAVPAYAGIPVTHRDFCSSIHVITAHAKAGSPLKIDFEQLVKMEGTLLFLMGVSALPFIMDGLLEAGISPEMPAAVIENGTRYNQRKLVAEVATLSARAREMQLQSPAIIIVGKVCALSERLDWFQRLPLHGKKIVVTRPRERAGTLAKRLRTLGAGVLEYPCIATADVTDTHALEDALAKIERYAWVVLTSPAGLPAVHRLLAKQGRDMRVLYGLKFAAIGNGTARTLEDCFIHADYIPAQFDARHLAEGLCEVVGQGERVLILRAQNGSPELTQILKAHAIAYDDVAVYDTICTSEQSKTLTQLIAAGQIAYVTFTSASTVEGFVQATPNVDVSRFTAICIGEQTAQAATRHKMCIKTAKNATIDDMIACILEDEKPWSK